MSIALLLQQTTTQNAAQLRNDISRTVREATQAAEEAARQAAAAAKAAHTTTITSDGRVITVPGPPIVYPGGSIQIPAENQIPPQVEPISIAFFAMIAIIVVGLPLMRAIARKIDRGTPVASPIPKEFRDQLQQISQSVDAIAIEVERISEGQRFTTKLLNDKRQEATMMAPGASGS